MSAYDYFRRKIAGPMAPLPIFYKDDLGIDYDGIGKYTAWLVDGGIRNMCLTYSYSRIAFVTQAELIEVTRTIARVVGDRAVDDRPALDTRSSQFLKHEILQLVLAEHR